MTAWLESLPLYLRPPTHYYDALMDAAANMTLPAVAVTNGVPGGPGFGPRLTVAESPAPIG